jgi:hypothetical protein
VVTTMVTLIAAVAAPATASAATTIGSQLAPAPVSGTCGTNLTAAQLSLASGTSAAPADGALVRWRLKLQSPGGSYRYELRVLHLNGGTSVTGVSTGPPQPATSAGVNELSLPAPIPISAGDVVGVDCTAGAPFPISIAAPTGSSYSGFTPPLLDGVQRSGSGPFNGYEVLVNADFVPKPSNAFSFAAVIRNKRKGIATLPVVLPGPGTLALSGTGVLAQQAAGRAGRKAVGTAGTVNLLVKPTGKKKRKLKRKGRVKVSIAVTFTPSGEIPGDPKTSAITVKLVKS